MSLTFRYILDLLFPRFCAVCSCRLSPRETAVCPACLLSLAPYRPAEQNALERVEGKAFINDLYSLYTFTHGSEVQRMIHSLKYHGYREVGSLMGRMAARQFAWSAEDFDLVIPIPLSREHYQKRGFNQAELVARGIAKLSGIPSTDRLLIRLRGKESQTFRGRHQRQEAIKGAFRATEPEKIKGQRVLLVDDVVTTGATISEAAAVLSDAGVASISVFTVSVAK